MYDRRALEWMVGGWIAGAGGASGPQISVTTYPSLNGAALLVGATLSACQVAGSYVWPPGGAVTETWTWLVDDVPVAGSYVIQPGDRVVVASVALSAAGLGSGPVLAVGPYDVQNSVPVAGDTSGTVTVAPGSGSAPLAMSAPTLTTTATRLTISKGADGSDGGSPITDYDYRVSTDGGSTWGAWAALASPQVVTGFAPGATNIVAQTRANNAIGKGAASPNSAAATMKVVTFVGYQNVSGTGANMTIDLTAALKTDNGGIGGPILENDVIFVLAGWATSSTNVDVQITGYTEIDDLFAGTTRAVNLAVAWKAMGATPDTSITTNASNSAGNGSAALALVYRYVDPTNPLDVAYVSGTHSATGTGSALADGPAITPVSVGAYIANYIAATGDTTPAGMTAPANMTLSATAGLGGTARGYRLAAARKTDWTAGAFDPSAWSTSESGASDSWAALTLALKPW